MTDANSDRDAVGIDTDADLIATAQGELASNSRLTFEVADIAAWAGSPDLGAALTIGVSNLDEWDEFEHDWGAGVRSVNTPEDHAFADGRAAENERYQGVLGFGWLTLTRAD